MRIWRVKTKKTQDFLPPRFHLFHLVKRAVSSTIVELDTKEFMGLAATAVSMTEKVVRDVVFRVAQRGSQSRHTVTLLTV
jgi:hypothetical protein